MQRKSENTQAIELPDEMLLKTFSFFGKSPAALSLFQQVNKQWNNVANDDALWRQMIRPEFYETLKQSSLSAKEFYKNHVDARIQTVYYVGSGVQVSNFNMGLFNYTESQLIPLTESTLLASLEKRPSFRYVFTDREQAIAYADLCASKDSHLEGYIYPPIFTFHCPDIFLANAECHINSVSKAHSHLTDDSHVSFMQLKIPASALTAPQEICYKTSLSLPSSSRRDWQLHVIPVTSSSRRDWQSCVISVTDQEVKNQNSSCSIS